MQPSSTFTVAVGTSWCNGKQTPLWATTINSSVDVTPQMPCIGQSSTLDPQCPSSTASWSTLTAAYAAQKALTQTGCPANLFDNDTTLNNSDASITSAMFGATNYDCKVGSNEIKYTVTSGSGCGTGTLTVSGTFYFDGSLSMGCGLKIVYSGQATMYFTGTVTQAGGTQLCGIASCTASWNPTTAGIIFIAGCWTNSTGSTLAASKCVYITGGSTAQWGAYATTAYQIDGGSANMGPVLANSLTVGGGSSTLIPFNVMPPGTPLNYGTATGPSHPRAASALHDPGAAIPVRLHAPWEAPGLEVQFVRKAGKPGREMHVDAVRPADPLEVHAVAWASRRLEHGDRSTTARSLRPDVGFPPDSSISRTACSEATTRTGSRLAAVALSAAAK